MVGIFLVNLPELLMQLFIHSLIQQTLDSGYVWIAEETPMNKLEEGLTFKKLPYDRGEKNKEQELNINNYSYNMQCVK